MMGHFEYMEAEGLNETNVWDSDEIVEIEQL